MPELAEFMSGLLSEEEKERAFAAEDIAYYNLVDGAIPLVERLQVEDSRFVREVIVNSLKALKAKQIVDNVLPLLRSDDAFLRNSAIDILVVQDESDMDSLRMLLHDPEKDVRKFVLDILVQLGTVYAVSLLTEALNDSDINNVITAVEYLGRLDASASINYINDVFNKTDNMLLRCTCLETMSKIGNKQSMDYVALKYPDYQAIGGLEMYSFMKYLARKGSELHLPIVTQLIVEKGEHMVKEIINALEGILQRSEMEYLPNSLLEALDGYIDSDINEINKYELLILLSDYKNEEISSIIKKHLTSGNRMVCLGAVEGAGNYGNKEFESTLKELRENADDPELLDAIEKSLRFLSS
ncbi:MAG: HEAT repeat domain-containing protein [Chitinophagales bacterium]